MFTEEELDLVHHAVFEYYYEWETDMSEDEVNLYESIIHKLLNRAR